MAPNSFDAELSNILNDHTSQNSSIDTSPATLTFIKAATNASAVWAIKEQIVKTGNKPFTDICELEDLKHHAQILQIPNIDSYIDEDGTYSRLVAAVNAAEQNPVGGGNRYDWARWAKNSGNVVINPTYTESVVWADSWENKRFPGSVDLVITSSRTAEQGGEQEPSSELLAIVMNYCDSQRTLGAAFDFLVWSPTKVLHPLDMTISSGRTTATLAACAAIRSLVISYIKSLSPGETLYYSQIESIVINYGCNIVTHSQSENITAQAGPDLYERIWPDEDNVNISVAV